MSFLNNMLLLVFFDIIFLGDNMDLQYLKRTARTFAYQLRKFYPEDETPINHYICKEHVIVLSNKRLFVYFYDQYIDYVGDFFSKIDLVEMNQKQKQFKVVIKGRIFNIIFEEEKDYLLFTKYYVKYSNYNSHE